MIFEETVNFCFNIGCLAVDVSVAQDGAGEIVAEGLLSFHDTEFAFDLVGEFGGSGEVGVVEDGGVGFRGQLLSLIAGFQCIQSL